MNIPRRLSWFDWVAAAVPFRPPEARERRPKGTARESPFAFRVGGVTHVRTAFTRSEARAVLKRDLRLKRLPAGA